MEILYSAVSDRGKVRRVNQDRIYPGRPLEDYSRTAEAGGVINDTVATFALFDGMGGGSYGDTAAQIAVDTLAERADLPLGALCRLMNERICSCMARQKISDMGATAAIVRFCDETVFCCNLGDSRVYLLRGEKMLQLSVDHTITAGGERPRRLLTQHLGLPENEAVIEPSLNKTAVRKGDRVLLCSDGLTDAVPAREISGILHGAELRFAAKELLGAALAAGGTDNISIITCEVR